MLNFEALKEACSRGGANVLTSVTELEPAGGAHVSVAPAKFVDGSNSVFAFERRFVDGEPVEVALIDSKQSQLNRAEASVVNDSLDSDSVVRKIPRITVDYAEAGTLSDMELPHRAFDAHIRAGSLNGVPVTQTEEYTAVRNSTTADLRPLLQTAPAAAIFGGWDSSRASHQLRLPSALVGEIVGVLADQEISGREQQSKRGGARVDPLAMSVRLDGKELRQLVDDQVHELSDNLVGKVDESIKKAKKAPVSAAALGFGGIPPALDSLGGVSCRRIIRTWTLSFAVLRQLRFGGPAENDVAGRAVLAAFGLAAMARAEEDLYIRANCHLVEKEQPQVALDGRFGTSTALDPITVEAADQLLNQAIDYARELGVADWDGQVLAVNGNPIVLGGAVTEDEDGEA